MAIAVVPHSTSYTMPEPLYNQYTAGPSSSITKAYAKPPNDDSSQSSYLPTPTSGGSPFDLQQQQQQQQQYHQHHQRQQQQYHQQQQVSDSNSTYSPQRQQVYHQPSPSHSNTTSQNNYSPSKANGQSNGMYDHRSPQPVAGPSSYRRTPNLHSPVSVAGDSAERVRGHGRLSAEHSPARGQHQPGRQTAMGEQVMMDGMERMAVDEGDGRIGTEDPFGERRYTELKVLGDGSFGTVWLCDWHSPVKSGTLLSAMQCGAGARPEWSGKRLVALKRMKRVWEGGWSQAKNLGEIYSLSRIPQHPAIIPLYDAFISPKSRELYFVFECMEGNLYQLTKSRRGRPLAAGLIASCFHQISTGLDHIHRHGYFHRDMKPENLLVTTTGLADYLNAEALTYINSARSSSADGNYDPQQLKYEKDVSVIVKLADFGLARAITSRPPYTEYVSTRWYRAPEVLLRSTEYGAPVDMWALGTILAEMLNLKPLFPGVSEIDQVYRITDTLGDPSPNYGVDERGRTIGGGSWNSGIILAKKVGFSFPKRKPVNFRSLFNENVPQSLIDCIGDLLLYNPKYRMTSAQCVQHAYFHETLPHLQRTPPLPRVPFSHGQPEPGSMPKPQPELSAPPRAVPPSHSHHETRPAFANGDMRTLPPPVGMPDMSQSRVIFPTQATDFERYEASALVNQLRELDLPTEDLHSYGNRPLAKPIQEAGQQPAPVQPNVQAPRAREWSENTTRQSTSSEVPYDGQSNSGQNPSYGQFSLAQQAQIAHMRSQSKVANYVQQQQQIQRYEDGTPRQPAANQIVIPPPIEPTRDATAQPLPSNTGKLASLTIGKKKKWGLSSVFGGGGDKGSTVSLSPISPADHTGYSGGSSSSLKRTQSGNAPAMSSSMLSPTTPIDDASAARVNADPKLAKKEAEKAKREAEKMKREAAARVQKERARAVMLKRQQIVSAQTGKSDATNIEALSGFTMDPEPQARKPQVTQPPPSSYAPSHYDQSSNQMAVDEQAQGSRHRPMDEGTSTRSIHGMLGASQSATSIRTYDSQRSKNTADKHSLHSYGNSRSQPQLPLSSDQQYGIESGMNSIGRHKARRRDEDDDHSMSSFGHNSMRSRSVLTIGTIDSDPGPRRGRIDFPDMTIPRQASKDPLVTRRPPSNSSRHHHALQPSRLASLSNPSLESQLARDFKAHANVAGSSQTSLHQSMSPQQIPPVPTHGAAQFAAKVGQGSAPTSPYGHPKGIAVAHGGGIGRNGTMLPSIRDWEDGQSSPQPDHQQYNGNINPMFKVPPAEQGRHAQQPTLPPFSDIARVADSHAQHQR